ncbi:MAG: alpha/beta hydrolase [Ardenticatenaceae bacterium]|nr:alpha/beta hydrolase [Anaerolineales bacterium]MCB8940619.1 alpha/beta hydrolase [Ardenticatenaceae bacterium]MCB8971949.1 alpha/beta hydrolase [Ardenticatenaceae bacterium]
MTTWTAPDGSEINFEQYGGDPNKPHLLLLPGLLGAISSQWRPFLKPLSEQFQLLLVDLRGHGRSQNNAPTLNVTQMAEDMIGLLDALKIERLHIAGYSLGGYLGLMMAMRQPRRVATLLMHATKFYWTAESAGQMVQQLNPDVMAEKVPTYADQLVKEHGGRQWRTLVRQAAELTVSLVEGGIAERLLKNVQVPVLVSVGDRDELVLLPEAFRLSRALPNGELLVLPNTRHPLQTVRLVPLLPMMQIFHTE